MSLRRRWQVWAILPQEMRWLLVEAVITLAYTRFLVSFGMRWCGPWMFRQTPSTAALPPSLARHIRSAIRIAAQTVPWKSVCLPNAMAGKLMLHRRGWASNIFLGAGFEPSRDLHAHAWLAAGGVILTGQSGIARVVPFNTTQTAAGA